MRKPFARTCAAVLLAALLVVAPACDPPKREQLVKVAGYGQQLAALIEANATLPDTLAAQGVITGDRANEIKNILEAARVAVDEFNGAMRDALAVERPDYAALVPRVSAIIAQVQKLTPGIKSDAWRKTLAVIETSLRGVASFFALNIRQARAAGFDDRKLARLGFDVRALRAVELYDAGR